MFRNNIRDETMLVGGMWKAEFCVKVECVELHRNFLFFFEFFKPTQNFLRIIVLQLKTSIELGV